jgi:hypothetical protein
MAQLKEVLREQYLLLRLDEQRAIATLPKLVPSHAEDRALTLRAIQRIVSAQGSLSDKGQRRLIEIEKLFGAKAAPAAKKEDKNVGA